MGALQVFVADVDQRHIDLTREALTHHDGLNFCGSARHGGEAFRCLMAHPADVLLTDLQLPGMDGGALLRALNRQPRRPVCIVCTRFYSDISVLSACRDGAAYLLYKPLDYARLPEIITECFRADRPPEPHPSGNSRGNPRALAALGFEPGLRGGYFIIEAMKRLRARPVLLHILSRGLYVEIAAAAGTTPVCVERSIRHAIAVAYARGSLDQRFPCKPTNRELLEYLLRETL